MFLSKYSEPCVMSYIYIADDKCIAFVLLQIWFNNLQLFRRMIGKATMVGLVLLFPLP